MDIDEAEAGFGSSLTALLDHWGEVPASCFRRAWLKRRGAPRLWRLHCVDDDRGCTCQPHTQPREQGP